MINKEENNKYCPECGSDELFNSGEVWCGRKKLQRYICKDCGRATCYPLTERPVELTKK